jgi:hypothetical protein
MQRLQARRLSGGTQNIKWYLKLRPEYDTLRNWSLQVILGLSCACSLLFAVRGKSRKPRRQEERQVR